MSARRRARPDDLQTKLLQDLLIVQLAALGVPQLTVQKIVGVDMNRVVAIARHIRSRSKKAER